MARVLLVDHNESVLKHVRAVLLQEGLDICGEAATGRQAIEEAARLKPDFIVLDHSLPDLTGVQVAYEIRQRLGNVRIVFFTFHDEAVISAAARVVGAERIAKRGNRASCHLPVTWRRYCPGGRPDESRRRNRSCRR